MKKISKYKISVIIPIYNICNQLEDALRTVVRQTHENLEIILVDDGSTDGSGELCELWKKKDNRIKCIHQTNAGVSVARNKGLDYSRGEFILFMDGDDEIASDMCEKLLQRLISKKADVSYCGYLNIFPDNVIKRIPVEKIMEGDAIIEELLTVESFFTSVWNKMFKRDVLKNDKGEFIEFQPGIYIGEDLLWLSKVLKNAKKVSSVSESLYYWKRRSNSATLGGEKDNQIRIDEKYLSFLKAYREVALSIADKNLKKNTYRKYLGSCRDCMLQAYKEKRYGLRDMLVRKVISDSKLYGKVDLFMVKLSLCVLLVIIKAPYTLIEKVQKMKRKVSE